MNISVVIPAHNAAHWLEHSLASVAAQTLPPTEVIVVNDASTDETGQVAGSSEVVTSLLTTEHGNGAASRNAGIQAASGDWIAFLDADDLWYPNHLERAEKLLRGSQDVAFLCMADLVYAEADRPIERRQSPWPYESPTNGLSQLDFLEHYARHFNFDMSGSLARRDVLLEVGMLDPALKRRHDIDMWLRVLAGRTWAYDPVASSAYRVDTPGAISRQVADREYFFLQAVLKNRQAYQGEAMDGLLRVAARRTLAAAFTDGDAGDRRRAMETALPHASRKDSLLFRAFSLCPACFALLNRARRARR